MRVLQALWPIRLTPAVVALVAIIGVISFPPPVSAQDIGEVPAVAPGTWTAYPAMRRVQAITSTDQALWVGTDGGVYRYDVGSGEIRRFTRVDGLAGVDVRTIAFDAARSVVWVGYSDGTIDRITTASGDVRNIFDIARADRYPQRGVNRIRPQGDSLLIATDFGVVVYDAAAGEVRDTYDKFGSFDRARRTFDVLAAPLSDGAAGFWVATQDGLSSARQDAPNLRVPSAWTSLTDSPAPALAIGFHGGRLYAGRERTQVDGSTQDGDVWRLRPDGSWERLFVTGETVHDVFLSAEGLVAASRFNIGVFDEAGARRTVGVQGAYFMESAGAGPGGSLWVGSAVFGVGRLPQLPGFDGGSVEAEEWIVPSGPLTNNTLSVAVGPDGAMWAGYQNLLGIIDGMGRFDGVTWSNYSTLTGDDAAQWPIRDIHVDRRGMAWGASNGGGLMRVDPDGTVTTFRSDNSTLRGEPGSPTFIVTLGVAEDRHGRIWVTNRAASDALHVWDEETGWTGLPRPAGTPGAASRVTSIYVDQFDNKWVGLLSTGAPTGGGFMVVRTGDPFDPSDDEAVAIVGAGSAATGTGLPDPNVRAFAEDLDGRLWIGTARGLAIVFSPGSVFANPNLATPSWARTPDQASYFLRDLNIYAIAVDPASRKWLASSDGAWLLNAAGNEVLAHFTPENSPLPSATVLDVAIDDASGTVYFATDQGIVSYRGDSVAPAPRADRLQVFPNPYRPEADPFVRVEGLVAETRIRILTIDGQVVASFDGRGGTATWDGRDQRTGQLVPSGVYLVAAAGLNGEGTSYGKIAIVR